MYEDTTSAMYVQKLSIPVVNYIYGIGGRDTTVEDIESVYQDLLNIKDTGDVGDPYRYLGLRRAN